MEINKNKNVEQLCNNIELFIDRKVITPKDFEFLSKIIFTRTHQYVSATTLKRIWGYLNETTHARTSTLDVLAVFLGYHDWNDFCNRYATFNPNLQEGPVTKCKLDNDNLKRGQIIEVEWMPNSSCQLEFMGNNVFKVMTSQNSRLKNGDIVKCSYIIEGESMYFTDSTINGKRYDIYYIGKTGGVTFKVVE